MCYLQYYQWLYLIAPEVNGKVTKLTDGFAHSSQRELYQNIKCVTVLLKTFLGYLYCLANRNQASCNDLLVLHNLVQCSFSCHNLNHPGAPATRTCQIYVFCAPGPLHMQFILFGILALFKTRPLPSVRTMLNFYFLIEGFCCHLSQQGYPLTLSLFPPSIKHNLRLFYIFIFSRIECKTHQGRTLFKFFSMLNHIWFWMNRGGTKGHF